MKGILNLTFTSYQSVMYENSKSIEQVGYVKRNVLLFISFLITCRY